LDFSTTEARFAAGLRTYFCVADAHRHLEDGHAIGKVVVGTAGGA
jgi:hypothetical protein